MKVTRSNYKDLLFRANLKGLGCDPHRRYSKEMMDDTRLTVTDKGLLQAILDDSYSFQRTPDVFMEDTGLTVGEYNRSIEKLNLCGYIYQIMFNNGSDDKVWIINETKTIFKEVFNRPIEPIISAHRRIIPRQLELKYKNEEFEKALANIIERENAAYELKFGKYASRVRVFTEDCRLNDKLFEGLDTGLFFYGRGYTKVVEEFLKYMVHSYDSTYWSMSDRKKVEWFERYQCIALYDILDRLNNVGEELSPNGDEIRIFADNELGIVDYTEVNLMFTDTKKYDAKYSGDKYADYRNKYVTNKKPNTSN